MSSHANAERITVGLTVREVARRYRVSPDRVRGWIRRGDLRALDTSDRRCRRPRWVVLPDALQAFELGRAAGPTSRPAARQKRTPVVDYYP
jgi:transposase